MVKVKFDLVSGLRKPVGKSIMSDIIPDGIGFQMMHKPNVSFAPGIPIQEMVAIPKDFGASSKQHSLKQASHLPHIVPDDLKEHERWFRYLDHLKTYPSDRDGRPIPHEMQEYIVISTRAVPATDFDRSSRIAARVRRIAESVGA
jgi:hypothetical protein